MKEGKVDIENKGNKIGQAIIEAQKSIKIRSIKVGKNNQDGTRKERDLDQDKKY